MWEIKKAGQVYAYGPGSRGCMLYIDGKKQKKTAPGGANSKDG